MYRIYIRDEALNKVGELTDYTKLELLPRFNAVGSFALDLQTDSFAARELIKPKAGIIVVRDGQTVFSGQVTSRKRQFGSNGDTLTLAGKDDMVYLVRRLAYPVPSGPPYNSQDYDVRTGIAETIMKQYVDANAGPSARPERQTLAIAPDTGLGSVITGRARFDNLLDLLTSLAIQGGGLGFRVVQVMNALEFQVYQPADKTNAALFSPLLGNMSAFDYSSDDPEANVVIVGGSGDGTSRIIQQGEYNDSITKFGRVEEFLDKQSTSDTSELSQAISEEFTNKAEKVSLNFTPIDTPSLSFGRDYGLGDKVSIVLTQPGEVVARETVYRFVSFYQSTKIDRETIRKTQNKFDVVQDVVREVKITIDSSGATIQPTVGTSDSTSNIAFGLFDKMAKAFRRIGNLERR